MLLQNQEQFLEEVQKYESIIILGCSNIGRTIYRYMKQIGEEARVKGFSENSLKKVEDGKLFDLPKKQLSSYEKRRTDSQRTVTGN